MEKLSIPEKFDARVKKHTDDGTGYQLPKSYNASYVNHMNKRLASGTYKLVGRKLFFVKKEDRVALEVQGEAPVQTAGKVGRPRKAKKASGHRGRPVGSKNKPKVAPVVEATAAPTATSEPTVVPEVAPAPASDAPATN